ncbi:hypothetical protein, conserved [Angomonas deanei]|uniref:Uncharacterized protein n=1 Tax=Angomonas deanei TaxID=59799 RepID=A0A7G2CP71_9TRYP|nr:hypothetical protein, conserved [Angomonas deanei]
MQEEVPKSASPTSSDALPDRREKVIATHEALERSMHLVTAFRKNIKSESDTEMLTEMGKSVQLLSVQAKDCLRLFNPLAAMKSTRGLETIGALYADKQPPHSRLHSFLVILTDACGGVLPTSVAVSGARQLHHNSPSAASEYLNDAVDAYIKCSRLRDDTLEKRLTMVMVGDDDIVKEAVLMMVRLEVECAVEAGEESRCLTQNLSEVENYLGAEAVERFEERYRNASQMKALRDLVAQQRLSHDKKKEVNQAALKKLEKKAGKETAASPTKEPTAVANPEERAVEKSWRDALWTLQPGWKLQTLRAVALLCFLLLVRYLVFGAKGLWGRFAGKNRPAALRTLEF